MAFSSMVFLFLSIMIILSGCGETPGADAINGQLLERELAPFDSIGIEMGDSNYVFGMLRALEFTSQGNIIVGDISRMKLLMYSPEGIFICSGGTEGQGPGEYTAPSGISTTPSGGILVADAMGGKLIFYDSLLNYSHELTGFVPYPPSSPEMLEDESIVGIRFIFDQEGGSLCNTLGRWEPGETELSFSYHSRTSDFDQQDPRKVFRETGMNYCVLQDGRVIASPLSTEEYVIICYNAEGEIEWELHPPFERQRRSEEDIEIEREMMRAAMRRNGRDPSFVDQMDFQEWADAVTGLYAQEDRIWARRGEALEPLFDIYSTDGEYLYSCSVPFLPYGSSLGFAISPYSSTVLAYLANPEDYSRIWMLREVDMITGEPFEETGITEPSAASPGLTLCTLSVHSDLEPFEISLYWTDPPDGAPGFRRVHTLIVKSPGDESITIFDGLESNYYENIELQGYLIAEDMNFDGYTDFRLMESPSAGPNTSWYFWLFDPDTGTFYRSMEYEESSLVSPVFDQDNKTIICFHRDGMGIYGTEYYIIENGHLLLVRDEQTEFQGPDSLVTTVSELVNGEMVVTEQNVQEVD